MDGFGSAAGVSHAIDICAHPGQVAEEGDCRDRRGTGSPEAGGPVEVELRRPAVAKSLIQSDGAGHEANGVEREYRGTAVLREALAGGQQSVRDTMPARGGMDRERASAGPAGRPAESLDRGVR